MKEEEKRGDMQAKVEQVGGGRKVWIRWLMDW